MKRLISLAATAVAAVLLLVPVASAQASLIPGLIAPPGLWLKLLHAHPLDPKPTQPHSTTISLYERTVSPTALHRQGCRAGNDERSGVAILDFGKPSYNGRHYGTILFSDKFAANWKITSALLAYAQGYVHCLPADSPATLTLARGTSNYHPAVPSAFRAGHAWARYTYRLGQLLDAQGLGTRVTSAAADDAEPAWDPAFHKTHDFFRGYASFFRSDPSLEDGATLYNYGSLDGGVGSIWKAWQVYYVSGGMRYAQALPEIYNTAMAREWGELARIVQDRFHGQVQFAGVLTQLSPGCRCSLKPGFAHRALRRALADYGAAETPLPAGGSNMGTY